MPNPPEIPKLAALTLDAIRSATATYLEDGNAARWEKTVASALSRGHQAAYILGAAERLGVSIESGLITPRNLSRAERDTIKASVSEQLDYLKRFIDVAGDLSDAQIQARADQYALATKQSYWRGWSGDEEISCTPGDCASCYSRCRCYLDRQEDGIHWICAEDDRSCPECVERANTWPFSDQTGMNGDSAE